VGKLWFVVCGLWFVVCGLWFVGWAVMPNKKYPTKMPNKKLKSQ
jgi:hypothetical protein